MHSSQVPLPPTLMSQLSTWPGVPSNGPVDQSNDQLKQLFERHPDADDACWSESRVLVVVVRRLAL